jgi:alanine racemase
MRATTATIDLAALARNLERARQAAPQSRVLAVVKADGYGHGLERVALALRAADGFGVATLTDAERIRRLGLRQRVVLLSGFDEAKDLLDLRALQVDPVIHHESQLRLLEADRKAKPMRVWLKFNTGMNRLGFQPAEARRSYERLRALPWIDPDIVLMTHFASADEPDAGDTLAQCERFAALTEGLPGPRSLANSAALQRFPATHADWVRPGGWLYGMSTFSDRSGAELGLEPAMSLGTRLIAINQLAAGDRIGYGGSYRCPEAMRVGIAAIGYGDGYPRALPSGTPILVAGRRASTVGRVSMDLVAIDLRAVPEAEVGSEVIAWGPTLPVEHIAAAAGTIGYELTCGVTRRVAFAEAGAALSPQTPRVRRSAG